MNLKLFNPELDEDGDYNTPYEITATYKRPRD